MRYKPLLSGYPFIIIFIVGLFGIFNGFFVHFYSSSLVQLGANKFLNDNNLDYFLYMFTSATSNGPQFRPISFFLYFYIMRSFFGLDIIWYHIAGSIMFFFYFYFCFNFFRKMEKDAISLIATCLIILHPFTFSMFAEIDMNFKYCIPMIYLIVMLSRIQEEKNFSYFKICFLIFFEIVVIMSHEASIVFPFIFIFYYWALKRSVPKFIILFMIPSLLYLIIRIFYFSLPSEGWMSLSLVQYLKALSFYVEKMFIPVNSAFQQEFSFLGVLLFFGWLILSLLLLRRGRRFVFFSFLSTMTLMTPFALLKNHVYFTRAFWGIFFIAFIFLIFLSAFNEKVQKSNFKLAFTTVGITLIAILFIWGRQPGKESRIRMYKNVQKAHQEVFNTVSASLKGVSPGQTVEVFFPVFKTWRANDWEILGFLALKFPEYRFIDFGISERTEKFDMTIVYNGNFYRRMKKMKKPRCHPTFSFRHFFKCKKVDHLFWIDPYYRRVSAIQIEEPVKMIDLTNLSDFTLEYFF